jgi:hypothetical protein
MNAPFFSESVPWYKETPDGEYKSIDGVPISSGVTPSAAASEG